MQDGYGERIKEAISSIIDIGAVGCNMEDAASINGSTQLLPILDQVSRIKTALSVARSKGVPDFVLNARTDTVMLGGTIQEAIERGTAYLDAGATTIFVWGGVKRGLRDAEVKQLVDGLGGRLNVIYRNHHGMLSIKEIGELGVARISMGPGLWKIGMAAVEEEMKRILH